MKNNSNFPQPAPLLNGILLLDKILAKNNEEQTSSTTTSHSGWYNVPSDFQTRSSVV